MSEEMPRDAQYTLYALYALSDGRAGVDVHKDAIMAFMRAHTFEEARAKCAEIAARKRSVPS